MLDETTPETSDALLATGNPVPLSATPARQYSSRRELNAATSSAHARGRSRVGELARTSLSERFAARRLNAPERIAPKRTARPAPRSTSSKKRQGPVVVIFTLLIVPGFIASASLPAFAFAPVGAEHEAEVAQRIAEVEESALPSQEVAVEEQVAAAEVKRDTITATTEDELRATQIAAAALAAYQTALAASARASSATAFSGGTATSGAGTVRAAGDDYPWSSAGNTLSPLNYYYRQCVDFVAWRLNRDAGSTSAPFKYVWSTLTPSGGNASQWKAAWQNKGWMTSTVPVTGAVAWFTGNHVAYVKEVVGSNVIIEEYNGMAKLAYAIRTIPISSVPLFLYPPPR